MYLLITKKLMGLLVLFKLLKKKYILWRVQKDSTYWLRVQNREIRKMVKHIYSIPFYKKRFDEAGLTPDDIKTADDFLKLPPLTKKEYRAWIESETKDSDKYKNWMRANTTGSTGSPLALYSLPRDRATEIANLFSCAVFQDKNYHPITDKIFSTMVPKPKKGQSRSIPREKRMSSVSPPEELVKGFNEFKPDFYYGNKTAILLIAQHALKHNIKLHEAKCVGSISEALDPNSRKIIIEAFGENKLFDIYGCAEVGNFAVEKTGIPDIHTIWNDTHVVNLLNAQKDPERIGYSTGVIMVTSLIHYGFPLVNYVIGDTVEVYEDPSKVKYITKICGRTDDAIKNEDGTSYNWLHVYRIMHKVPNVAQFRVIQKTYDKLLFVLASNVSVDEQKQIEAMIQDEAKEIFWDPKNQKELAFEWCEQIPPDPNGKLRILVSEI